MTRKDFEKIAWALKVSRLQRNQETEEQWAATVKLTADALAGTNANFDRARFLKACGYAQ